MIEIKKISAEKTYNIRLEVLRKNIPLPYRFNGDFDEETFHLGAFLEGELIAVSTYVKASKEIFKGEQYQLRGMATLEKHQGYGAGKKMLEAAISILTKNNISCLWCNARVIAVDFYKKQGLQTIGEKFNIKHVGPHYVMFMNLG